MTYPAQPEWDWVKIRKTFGPLLIGVVGVIVLLTMLVTCSGSSSSSTTTRKYNETECQALRITALSESSNAEDAAVQYEVYC